MSHFTSWKTARLRLFTAHPAVVHVRNSYHHFRVALEFIRVRESWRSEAPPRAGHWCLTEILRAGMLVVVCYIDEPTLRQGDKPSTPNHPLDRLCVLDQSDEELRKEVSPGLMEKQ